MLRHFIATGAVLMCWSHLSFSQTNSPSGFGASSRYSEFYFVSQDVRQALQDFKASSPKFRQAIPQASQPASVRFDASGITPYAFSNRDTISNYIVQAINNTKTTLDIALYALTLTDVADSMIAAHKRGVTVRVILNLDAVSPNMSPEIASLVDAGVNVRKLGGLGQYGIMHNKIAICDSSLLIAGSFNWTKLADANNFENAIFMQDSAMISGYQQFYEWMWTNSQDLKNKKNITVTGTPPTDPSPSVAFNGALFPTYSFSPQGGTLQWLLNAINSSKKSIDIAVYSFYSPELATALVKAKKRGVSIRVIMDNTQGKSSPNLPIFLKAGIPTNLSKGRGDKGMMHNKFAVFDGAMLETGSYNWTKNAECYNFENSYFTASQDFIGGFQNYFEYIYSVSTPASESDISATKGLELGFGFPEGPDDPE